MKRKPMNYLPPQRLLQLWQHLDRTSAEALAASYEVSARSVQRLRAEKRLGMPRRIQRAQWYVKNRGRLLEILERDQIGFGWGIIWRKVEGAQAMYASQSSMRTCIVTMLVKDGVDIPPQHPGFKRPQNWLAVSYRRNRHQSRISKRASVARRYRALQLAATKVSTSRSAASKGTT